MNGQVEATLNRPRAAQVFDEAGTRVYDTRGPRGERMRSHWPTVLPPLAPAPGVKVGPGSTVVADFVTDLRDGKVSTPVRYSIACDGAGQG